MSNDSATGGALSPIAPVQPIGSGPVTLVGSGPVTPNGQGAPPLLEDDALDDFFQVLVVNITGLAGKWVRPRFQEEPPALPPVGTTWAAVGVNPEGESDFAPYVGHENVNGGQDRLIRHETFEVLCSFYGPNAKATADLLRDGLAIAQNREPLFLAQMALADVGRATRAPTVIKGKTLNRWDLTITIRRAVERVFPVLSLESAGVTLTEETSAGVLTATITAAD